MNNFNQENMLSNVEARSNIFLKKVYLWMTLGLAVTALSAFLVSSSETMLRLIYGNPFSLIILCVAEIALVMVLSGRLERMSRGAAFGCFFGYSALTGVTLSSLIIAFTGTGILTLSFVTAAVIFAVAAIYGSVTKKSIKGWGGWLSMGLISLIVVTLINMLLRSTMLEMIISGVGVVLFSLLTAWDSQKLMDMNRSYGAYMTQDELDKISIMGALELYLDFLNIFMYLVRIFSNARDN